MRYFKIFSNENNMNLYAKENFISPHIYLDDNSNEIYFMEEYRQLEYISSTSTGGQYIDLGCKLLENTDDIRIDIKFNVKNHGKTGVGQSTLIASQPEVNPYPGFTLRINGYELNDYRLVVVFSTKWMCSTDWTKYQDVARKWFYNYKYMEPVGENTHLPLGGGSTTSLNEVYEYSILLDDIPASQINNFNCHLFCALDNSNTPFRFIEADLYYLKFTKGNQVIRNLIPVKKISTNEIGLYDLVTDHLYISQGDDPFVAGPEILY